MVTICTASLTFNNSTFCPHSVFMCFVWISEQTAIISLYNTNWLVFITQTQCVHCAVRTACSSINSHTTHTFYLQFMTAKHRNCWVRLFLTPLFSDAASCSVYIAMFCTSSVHWQSRRKPKCSEQPFLPFFHHKERKGFHGIEPILLLWGLGTRHTDVLTYTPEEDS